MVYHDPLPGNNARQDSSNDGSVTVRDDQASNGSSVNTPRESNVRDNAMERVLGRIHHCRIKQRPYHREVFT